MVQFKIITSFLSYNEEYKFKVFWIRSTNFFLVSLNVK